MAPGGNSRPFSDDGGKSPARLLDQSPTIIGDRRPNNLGPSESIPPRDASSQVNSVQSSTIPGEGASLTSMNAINRTHLGTPTKLGSLINNPRATGGDKVDRRSVISAITEFK